DGRAAPDQRRFADSARAKRPAGVGILQHDALDLRHVANRRQDVIGEPGIENLAVLLHDFFHQRHSDALRYPALNLADDLIRVDGFADVVTRDVALDLDFAGLGVHKQLARVAAEEVSDKRPNALTGLRVLRERRRLI